MSVNGVNALKDSYGVSTSQGTSKTGDTLGKDAFLNLLVTQLKYQDPLNPTSDKDFLAQMAQFSSLEQMQNLNSSSQMSQAYSLIGKVVSATMTNPDTLVQTPVQGFVDAVSTKAGKVYLLVDGKEVSLSAIENVTYVDYDASSITSIKDINITLKAIQEQLKALTEKEEASTTDDAISTT